MKRLMFFLLLLTSGVLLATANAFMQVDLRPRHGEPQRARPGIATSNELPRTYLNQGRLHKLIITSREMAVYNRLTKANAVRGVIDYGSYKLVVIDEEAVGGRSALQTLPVAIRDDQNLMVLNGYVIDTSNPKPLSKELPADLKQSRMSLALAGAVPPGSGLYLIQFAGPIRDEWYQALEDTGATIITYTPNNSYLVRADDRAAGELIRMKASSPFVQWLGDYEAGYKLAPGLQARHQRGDLQPVKVTIQLIDNAESNTVTDGAAMASRLRSSALRYYGERRVQKYRNITVAIPGSQLAELAKSDEVLTIEESAERVRLDEVQGQIVAGNLSGNAPGGPGYLTWLASKGFDSSQFNSFVINVVDDAFSLRGHPDLPDSRIAFENNPSRETFHYNHGFLNAHIIAGFNDGTDSAYEDANGFNYGLGIVPWARVGVTAIFGNAFPFPSPTPSSWEEAAYGQGARISSNSWGHQLDYYYDTNAQEYDYLVRDAQQGIDGNQQLTIVFAAGNEGPSEGTVTSPGTAKNVITVGASENVRPGIDGCGIDTSGADSANDIASFSSRGYTGITKPEIVAPGTHIQAGIPQPNLVFSNICDQVFPPDQTLYSWSSGTSQAAPAVAGGAALVYQDFLNKGMEAPSPAMIKAILMNSASYLTGAGANDTLPSPNQGMGLMNLGRTFDGTPRLLTDQTHIFKSTGETFQITGFVATATQPFRVTLVWTDAPGPAFGFPRVNELDLEVTIDDQIYKGNNFSGASSVTGGTADFDNNAESVFLPAGIMTSFTVTVRASNLVADGIPGNGIKRDQDFALVIYNATSATPEAPVIGVKPGRLNVSAAAGGPNPANRTLKIVNNALRTLNWSASDDASWMTVTPASGTAPSTLTVSFNTSGLSIGTYTGAIAVSSPDAPNSPFIVPVTLEVDGIANGRFEEQPFQWALSGAAMRSTGNYSHAGKGYLILGGANSSRGQAYQRITIPKELSLHLTFWLNVTSIETADTANDKLFVEVCNRSGKVITTLATFSNLDRSELGDYKMLGSYRLARFTGRPIRIQFRCANDSSSVTHFRIDDVLVR